jgi:hypothetical protein
MSGGTKPTEETIAILRDEFKFSGMEETAT